MVILLFIRTVILTVSLASLASLVQSPVLVEPRELTKLSRLALYLQFGQPTIWDRLIYIYFSISRLTLHRAPVRLVLAAAAPFWCTSSAEAAPPMHSVPGASPGIFWPVAQPSRRLL